MKSAGGAFAIATDPVNHGTLYVGSDSEKLWKSTDCGATWIDIAKGRNGDLVNSGMNWTLAVDPEDSRIVYTNSGYGEFQGLYKSVDGGVNWDIIWPPRDQENLADAFTYNFANILIIDPYNPSHIVLTFHESCLRQNSPVCIAESFNKGSTWSLVQGRPNWNGNEGQVFYFLDNSSRWLWGSSTNGFYQTSNRGATWEQIPGLSTVHLQGTQLARLPSGALFVSGQDGVWSSPGPEGFASSWRRISNSGHLIGGLVSDGNTLYTSTCYAPGFCEEAEYLKSTNGGATWVTMPGPRIDMGGSLAVDSGHGLMFSSNLDSGVWRVRLR